MNNKQHPQSTLNISQEQKKKHFVENDFLDAMVNLKKNFSKKRLNEVKVIGKAVYGGKNKAEEEPEEKKGKFGFGRKEKKFKEEDKKFGKGGKLNSTNKKWIEEKDDVSIRIGLADYLLIEKHSYASADLLLKTALQAGIKVFETDEL